MTSSALGRLRHRSYGKTDVDLFTHSDNMMGAVSTISSSYAFWESLITSRNRLCMLIPLGACWYSRFETERRFEDCDSLSSGHVVTCDVLHADSGHHRNGSISNTS